MAKQPGPCVVTKGCVFPGPHVRIAGTNQFACGPHQRLLSLAGDSSGIVEGARVSGLRTVSQNRALSSWAYTGIVARRG